MKRGEILLLKGYSSDVFLSDFLTIKQYGDNYWTVVKHKTPVRQAGFEDESLSDSVFDNSLINCSVDEKIKLDNNICRARSTILNYPCVMIGIGFLQVLFLIKMVIGLI